MPGMQKLSRQMTVAQHQLPSALQRNYYCTKATNNCLSSGELLQASIGSVTAVAAAAAAAAAAGASNQSLGLRPHYTRIQPASRAKIAFIKLLSMPPNKQ
jgi:hypothetical protein